MDYNHLRGRGKSAALPRLLLSGFIVLLVGGASFMFYEYKAHPEWVEDIAAYRENIGTWLAERKKSMHHGVGKVSNAPEEDDGDRPVNFEFYSTLQDMKSMQAEAHSAAQRKLAEKNSQEAVVKAASSKTMADNKRDSGEQSAKKTKSVKISHAADLEKDLLATIKQTGGGE